MLQLPAEDYRCFRVRMRIDCEDLEKGVLIQVQTTEGVHKEMFLLPAQTMVDLRVDLTAAKGTITQFRIEPQMTDCCIHVDWIRFE